VAVELVHHPEKPAPDLIRHKARFRKKSRAAKKAGASINSMYNADGGDF
jgi:hypothetical protein